MDELNIINHLAALGFNMAQPKGYKPHTVERLFRESVKGIINLRGIELSSKDYKATVSGHLQKTIRRMGDDQAFIPELKNLDAKADEFADYFVSKILEDLCDGKPGRLKKISNNLADGYYSAILRIRRDYWIERNKLDEKEEQ
ncbi:type I-D CRISPR-associated protein Cas10d/Csc3 [Methanohalophilus sp. DAL1]|jgi:CRISPR-associated protein Csc3|uniref:type I-D CRISPR-associated protein Cas10d/Csc3 n=1 Tax=Methanohalophilus sp. DAL1 TaxID=1864608 RepID=UPI0008181FF4|nr:type I-D CRISPR-associated protein Cas10d/Csc3 [Methanohalophilus sp. DAL1]OBZ35417.1 MAG: type I-D CRISPR-associated protein Cas10d/Csc3 [Methanohalophilus sp. DAL1]